MARRVSWTNNSSGHTGTYVYRAETLDPQNLPAPVATVDPVAQGATAEWVDSETLAAGDYDYAVQDFDGQGVGPLSAVEVYTALVDYSTAEIGDYIGGGVYAGVRNIGGGDYHIICAPQAGEAQDLIWSNEDVLTGADSSEDGVSNQAIIVNNNDISFYPAFNHCFNYANEGFTDWYLPSTNELQFVRNALYSHPELTNNTSDYGEYTWSSTEYSYNRSHVVRLNDNAALTTTDKQSNASNKRARPIRRVAV